METMGRCNFCGCLVCGPVWCVWLLVAFTRRMTEAAILPERKVARRLRRAI